MCGFGSYIIFLKTYDLGSYITCYRYDFDKDKCIT